MVIHKPHTTVKFSSTNSIYLNSTQTEYYLNRYFSIRISRKFVRQPFRTCKL